MRFAVAVLAFTALTASAQAQTRDRAHIAAAVDSIVTDALKDGRAAGMSVAVVRGRDTVVMKGYGFADLEFDVATPPRAVYEIGSITKQFTAAAVLLLQEQGKLSLEDELTKYLPNYPAQGKRITLRRLLDHTSGIKGYTEMPEFGALMMRKLPRDSLVAMFAARPFDFEPGEAQIYNNSAFFLLGLVIEKASGQTYEEFVSKNLFERAGMRDSRYCSERAVIKNRANGYDASPNGLLRAAYLDHTWPYAAGSLCSSVQDLIAWNRALHGGKILSVASYREFIAPGTLNDGTRLRYAKGISVDSVLGRRALHHGGGINGFLSDLKYFPDDSLHIAVLINTAGPVAPGAITQRIAQTIFGPWSLKAMGFTGKAEEYVGEYRGVGRGRETVVNVVAAADGKGLARRLPNGTNVPMLYLGGEQFDQNGARFTFVREGGRVTRLRFEGGSTFAILTRR
jgi:CubicO group peptidase (beta-lactamase class C family)